jgi:translation initiation factor 1
MIDIPDFVFPTDAQGNKLCPRCKKPVSSCDCPVYEAPKPKPAKFTPTIKLDKSGRKGKIVTVIKGLPLATLKDLSTMLKTKIGSGGTYYVEDRVGVIEIQGDHKDVVQKILSKNI